jgi:hypothetical protein
MKIDQATSQMISELLAQLEPRVHEADTLEDAAQELVASLQEKFDESVPSPTENTEALRPTCAQG